MGDVMLPPPSVLLFLHVLFGRPSCTLLFAGPRLRSFSAFLQVSLPGLDVSITSFAFGSTYAASRLSVPQRLRPAGDLLNRLTSLHAEGTMLLSICVCRAGRHGATVQSRAFIVIFFCGRLPQLTSFFINRLGTLLLNNSGCQSFISYVIM